MVHLQKAGLNCDADTAEDCLHIETFKRFKFDISKYKSTIDVLCTLVYKH